MSLKAKDLLLTRRELVAGGVASSAVLAAGCGPAKLGDRESLTEGEARTLGVICDEIVPGDEFPSATQAGVLDYIDRQLARAYRRHRDAYTEGLEQAERLSRAKFGKTVAELGGAERLETVRAIERENGAFFELVRSHTMEGYYGSPRHGGNRDAVSWRMLGLEEPPVRGRAQFDLRKGSSS